MNGCALKPGFDPRQCRLTCVNRWIAGATRDCAAAVTPAALEGFRFDEAAHLLYHFVWGTLCDWYLEFTKPILQGADAGARAETQATTAWVLGADGPSACTPSCRSSPRRYGNSWPAPTRRC